MAANNDGRNDECGLLEKTVGGGGYGGGDHANESGGGGEETVLKKGPWMAAEDAILVEYVTKNGEGNWNAVQRNTGLARCGKSCRLRWANHLRPNLKKGAFSAEEEKLIIELHAKYGNKWARMATLLPGRTDNEIKNYWNTRVKRRQRQGLPLYTDTYGNQLKPFSSSAPTTPTGTKPEFHPLDIDQQNHCLHPLSPILPSNTSLSSSLPLIIQRPTPILNNQFRFKRYRPSSSSYNSLFIPNSTPNSAAPNPNSVLQDQQLNKFRFPDLQINPGFSQTQLKSNQGLSFFCNNLEIPLNQFSQTLEPEISNFYTQMNDQAMHANSTVMLEDLGMASRELCWKKRSYSSLNEGIDGLDSCSGFDNLPLNSDYWPSSTGLQPKEVAPYMNEDLSNFATVMPSVSNSMQFPNWHIDHSISTAAQVSNNNNAQSYNSSTFILSDNFGLDDMKPMTSSFHITNTNHDYYSDWDHNFLGF